MATAAGRERRALQRPALTSAPGPPGLWLGTDRGRRWPCLWLTPTAARSRHRCSHRRTRPRRASRPTRRERTIVRAPSASRRHAICVGPSPSRRDRGAETHAAGRQRGHDHGRRVPTKAGASMPPRRGIRRRACPRGCSPHRGLSLGAAAPAVGRSVRATAASGYVAREAGGVGSASSASSVPSMTAAPARPPTAPASRPAGGTAARPARLVQRRVSPAGVGHAALRGSPV